MVVMRWRPWPPMAAATKIFEVRLVVVRLDGLPPAVEEEGPARLAAEVRWKGGKVGGLGVFRRSVKRNMTREEGLEAGGVVEWKEEFVNVCSLFLSSRKNKFYPWEVALTVFMDLDQNPKTKVSTIGTASLNLAEVVSAAQGEEIEKVLPLTLAPGFSESQSSLHLSVCCLELRAVQESSETVPWSIVPVQLSPQSEDSQASDKNELSALKAGFRKVKIFKEFVSARRSKKACVEEEGCDGRYFSRSDDGECTTPLETDSLDEVNEGESSDEKGETNLSESFSYGTLATANCAGGSSYSEKEKNGNNDDWFYYSNGKSDVGLPDVEVASCSGMDQSKVQISKLGILSWRKRKLSFRSPKTKGEPLRKKANGEDGGDDIHFDRRQLTSSDESSGLGGQKIDGEVIANRSSVSDFGDDNFAVGSWEQKEVTSRDGHLKLSTQVFFASIDQRNKKAAGGSACTALVAVIADWFQTNPDILPIKSQFDTLIREGSLEWRNLCENETYRAKFPDKHFDLETVVEAGIRPLSVIPERSFIGFFSPDNCSDSGFDFLHEAMSFDKIWDEISQAGSSSSDSNSQMYIVSWNDHFFILKVESEAFYIIDILGERLYEGCNQAYILKFDKETRIERLPADNAETKKENPEKSASESEILEESEKKEELEIVSEGKEACKEYIKNFLAAIPIRELLDDVKKVCQLQYLFITVFKLSFI